MFDQLVKDHFLLADGERQRALLTLCDTCPLFCSLFVAIVLDMLANSSSLAPSSSVCDKCAPRLVDVFAEWTSRHKMLPLLAFNTNMAHSSSYMLNPVPGLVYMSVVYPLKTFVERLRARRMPLAGSVGSQDASGGGDTSKPVLTSDLDELAFKVHIMELRLIRDLANMEGVAAAAANSPANSPFKLVTLKHLENLSKQIDELSAISMQMSGGGGGATHEQRDDAFERLLAEAMERLAQMLELCWQNEFISCTRGEVKQLFLNKTSRANNATREVSFMEIVLS